MRSFGVASQKILIRGITFASIDRRLKIGFKALNLLISFSC